MEALFIGIAIVAALALHLATGKNKWVLILFVLWSLVLSGLAQIGFYKVTDSFPPRLVTVLIPSVAIVIFLFRNTKINQLNLVWLIAIHILRIPVEICLHQLFLEGLVPEKMTYTGFNFDILSGISAIPILVMHLKGNLTQTVLKYWNIATLILLAIVVFTAVLSVPGTIQLLSFDQPNKAVLLFPYVLLPGVIVPSVLLSHLLIFRISRVKRK